MTKKPTPKIMTKKPTPKKSPNKKKTLAEARAKLAEGAKAIKASNGAKPAKRVIDNTLPEIEECTLDVPALMKKRVKIDPILRTLEIADTTTTGEYMKIFDNLVGYSEGFQFLVGDLIIKGEKLPCMVGKYTALMLSTGRSLDSLKAYRSVAFHTPPELRLLPYTHTRETVKIPKLEDRKAVIEEAAELAKDGKLPTVEEMRKKADRFKARKPKPKKAASVTKEGRDIAPEEEPILKELEEEAAHVASHVEMSDFIFDLKDSDVKKLRELLGRIAASHTRLTA